MRVKFGARELFLRLGLRVGEEREKQRVGGFPSATFEKLAPYPETEPRAFPPLAAAWVVAVEPIPNDTGVAWPWRAALAPSSVGQIYDRANVLLPARSGATTLKLPLPAGASRVKVVLLEGGAPRGEPVTIDVAR